MFNKEKFVNRVKELHDFKDFILDIMEKNDKIEYDLIIHYKNKVKNTFTGICDNYDILVDELMNIVIESNMELDPYGELLKI